MDIEILKMKEKSDDNYIKKDIIFDVPFRLLIIGKSFLSGKTTVLSNLILRDIFYKNDFEGENIFIVCPTSNIDSKWKTIIKEKEIPSFNIYNELDENKLDGIYELLEEEYKKAVEEKKKPEHFLFIFDDVSYKGQLKNKKYGIINKLFCNGRHICASTILISQKYSDISTTCRENSTGAIIFASTDKQLEQICEDHNYLTSKKAFKEMFKEATQGKHSFIVINYSNDFENRYLDMNFKPILKKDADREEKIKKH